MSEEMFKKVETSADISILVSVARTIWTEHYTPIIGSAQVDYMLENFHSKETVAKQIDDENYHYYLIKVDNAAVGYFGVQVKENELFLSKLYVCSSQRGKGIGRQSLVLIEHLGKQFGVGVISLTVNKNNSKSIAAYYRFGFVKTGEVCVDIGDSYVMDDITMELSI
ncbi:MAG: GNAT family N-acetyltransferase [Halopseudomonas sp.]